MRDTRDRLEPMAPPLESRAVVTITETENHNANGLSGCDSTSTDGTTCTVTMNGLRNLSSSPWYTS
jgi:hypothetical protein